jgi:mannose-6-phosphate isomerase-like protein (cupin superfamily)
VKPPMIERICAPAGQELAVILRREFKREGIEFITANDYSQQLGYMHRPVGYVIAPHVHNPISREVRYTKEVLFVKSGRVRVDFYTEEQAYIESAVLRAGDVILLAYGGHGFTMLEPTEMIEVKQGPYVGDHDKTRFAGVALGEIKLRSGA